MLCEPLMFGWFILVLMFELDFCNECNDLVGFSMKALVWFWIIDETLVLTSILSVCRLNEVGTCQVMDQVMIMVMLVMTTR